MLSMFDFLVHPTFFDPDNPPVKLNIPAKIVGLIAAILAALGLLGYLLAIPAVMLIGSAYTVFGVETGVTHSGILFLALAGLVVGIIANLLEVVGGWQMYQGKHEGKSLLIAGLAVGVIGSILYAIGFPGGIGGLIIGLVITFIIYYVIVISRFPDQAPLTGTTAPPPPPPTA